ncbi:hypothetical protein C823_005816 [Eubacterium plexicaudatum ASF492]|nr:hypothetical protein C823_005816 [Eubacterium plexicaudatum ASF492]
MNADAMYTHSREPGSCGGDTPNPQSADSRLTLGSLFDGSGVSLWAGCLRASPLCGHRRLSRSPSV